MNHNEFDTIYNSVIGTLLSDDFEDFVDFQYHQVNSSYIIDDEGFRDLMSVFMGMSI